MDTNLYRRRQRTNKIGITLSMLAMGLGLTALLWILAVLVGKTALLAWVGRRALGGMDDIAGQ